MGAVKALVTARVDDAYRLGRAHGDADGSCVIGTCEAASTCLRSTDSETWDDRYGPTDTPIASDADMSALVVSVVGSDVTLSDHDRQDILTAYESAYVESYRDRVWSDTLRLATGHKPI